DHFSDAEAAGGVLAIDDNQVELPLPDQLGQPFVDDLAPGAADHIADEENAHAVITRGNRSLRVPLTRDRGARRGRWRGRAEFPALQTRGRRRWPASSSAID